MKFMLAEDAIIDRIIYPIIVQPKIDGVRAGYLNSTLTGRSLKQHANYYVSGYYSNPIYSGLDGELAYGNKTDSDLCRKTTSLLNSYKDISIYAIPSWHLFDYITVYTYNLPYLNRYEELVNRVSFLNTFIPIPLNLVPCYFINNEEQLLSLEDNFLNEGYEGIILRDPNGRYKEGRSTVNEGGLLRIKRFIEEDAVVLDIEEGNVNNNEAQINELGYKIRSSHKVNKSLSGKIGVLICKDLKSCNIIKVAAGAMTDIERTNYFTNPELIINSVIKYKFFPKGIKNKPRFPTFVSFRLKSDMV